MYITYKYVVIKFFMKPLMTRQFEIYGNMWSRCGVKFGVIDTELVNSQIPASTN